MNAKQRQQFRKSKEWKAFRVKCRLHTSKDYITNKPLERDWNLHHLDLNVGRYDNIEDMSHFLPLNKPTHEAVHVLYNAWKKDKKVLDRLLEVLKKMEEYTNAKDNK